MSKTIKPTTAKMYEAIKDDFYKMSEIVEYGVKKYTTAYIMNKLAEKYYKSPKTIENIVFERNR